MTPAFRLTLLCLLPTLLGACGMNVAGREKVYRQQKVQELVTEYERARMGGDLLDLCVKSNMIGAGYEDIGNEGDALAWRSRNREDCETARAALIPADR